MKRLLTFVCIIVLAYFGVSAALILWPVPPAKGGAPKTLDFHNLPAVPSGDQGSEAYYTASDGRKLFYRSYGSSSDRLLILLHGSSGDGRYLVKMASALAASGAARVALPDLRGHGRSAYRRGDVEYIGQLEDDIRDFIETYKRQNAGARIFLGGHSSGGGLAIRFGGNKNMPKVEGYLLLAPYLAYDAPTQRPDAGGWATPNIKRIVGLVMLNHIGIHYFDYLPVLRFNRPSGDRDPLATLTYSHRLRLSYEPRRYREDLRNIRAPVYVIVGSDDDAFYADKFEAVFKADAADSRVDVIGGVNHMGLVGDERVIKAAIAWLKNR